ncbi:MAG: nitronate monooxygenase [Sphaerochaetaceae bacterium]|nr:nitronate monooxygenase [Sphaerochaetaceae bacterium]
MNIWTYKKFQNLVESVKMRLPMPSLQVGDMHSDTPIIQGGMGVAVSLSSLSSAVAESGGIGVIAANGIGMIEPDYFKDGRAANIRALRSQIRSSREKTNGLIGVNIMVALQDFYELLAVSIEEKVDMVIMGAGLPIKNMPVKQMREAGVKAVPIVSSSRAAKLIFSMWKRMYKDVPDAVVVEGPKAGGHLGIPLDELDEPAHALERVVPEVVQEVKAFETEFSKSIPVIAAGGIFTGEDIYRIMKLGASGVQMGTRFIATDECDAELPFKEALVACREEDIGIIKSPVGLPGRAIMNDFLRSTTEKKRTFSCPWQCLAGCQAEQSNYCISMALNQARRGHLKSGFVFVGSNAPRVKSIESVAHLMGELKRGYFTAFFADKKQLLVDTAERFSALKAELSLAESRLRHLKENMQAINVNEEIAKVSARLERLRDDMMRCLNGLVEPTTV